MGNSRWRLETALNYAGARVLELGREKEVEIIVTDWGSGVPLSGAVKLDLSVAGLVSFLLIPPSIARDLQKDSPFPEVLALNAAARRARGEYVGRIDQDTLAGKRFFDTFFALYEGRRHLDIPLDSALLFSNLRIVPYRFAVRCPPLPVVERFVSMFARRMRVDVIKEATFYKKPVGIWLVHKRLWSECGGYDERMIYMGYMEINMIARLMEKYQLVNLGKLIDYDFYHLEHYHPFVPRYYHPSAPRTSPFCRTVNQRDFCQPGELNPNGDGWGLAGYVLQAEPCAVASAQASAGEGRAAGWAGLFLLLPPIALQMAIDGVRVMVRDASRIVVQRAALWSYRAGVVRATVRGHSPAAWPRLLKERLRQRKAKRMGQRIRS